MLQPRLRKSAARAGAAYARSQADPIQHDWNIALYQFGRRRPTGRDQRGAPPPAPADHSGLYKGGHRGAPLASPSLARCVMSSCARRWPATWTCAAAWDSSSTATPSCLASSSATWKNTRPTWLSFRTRAVRGFARYLRTLDPSVEVPPPDLLPGRTRREHTHGPHPCAVHSSAALTRREQNL